MELLRLGVGTLNQTPLDFVGNRNRILEQIAAARQLGVEILLLPELSLTGYGCEDAFFSLSTARSAEQSLGEILPKTLGMTVVLGLPIFRSGSMYNCAALVQDGRILGVNAKRVLPREGVHYEPRWFQPWPFGKRSNISLCGQKLPFGDIRYRLGGIGVAIEICEEAWDVTPSSAGHANAVDLVLNPSGSHFALGKYALREHLVANSSRSLHVVYAYANLVGLEAGRIIYDGGALIAEGGRITTRGPRFGFEDGTITWRDLNPEMAALSKLKATPIRAARFEEMDPAQFEIVGVDPRRNGGASTSNQVVLAKRLGASGTTAARPFQPLTRNEEFLQAEMLGLFDYLRKSRARGYVVSLSGGCDSSATATLVAHSLTEALAALGPEAMAKRLGLIKAGTEAPTAEAEALSRNGDPRAWIRAMLSCVYQATEFSGPVTLEAARTLAEELGAEFHVADVQPMVDLYRAAAEQAIGRALNWQVDDVSLQNVQARVRAPLVWLLANVSGRILLTTSNRSEAAVGYATMDGDTAGGLAPLAGIDKHFLRQWLCWAEKDCHFGLGPLVSLAKVNVQVPTAELRPGSARQTDEGDLMPYAILDRIERYFVRDRLGPGDIVVGLMSDFPEISEPELKKYVGKFFRLWAASQWKRERLAPGFHVDDESLDPKTWCRFPILSAPYRVD